MTMALVARYGAFSVAPRTCLGRSETIVLAARIDADDIGGDVVNGIADDRLHLHRRADRARQPGFQRRHGGERILDAAPAPSGVRP